MSEVKTNKISSVSTNGDITLDPDGTGNTIVASGNVGIGTTSPESNSGYTAATISSTTGGQIYFKSTTDSVTAYAGADSNGGYIASLTNHPLILRTNNTERTRIDNSGNLRVANTSMAIDTSSNTATGLSVATSGLVHVATDDNVSSIVVQKLNGSGSENALFFLRGSSGVGSIRTTDSATAFNTTSDHRLKENVADMTGAIARVKQLAPKRFNFIVDADTTVDGFLAHEAQAVVPEAVHGTHNEVDDDGNPVMQGIDQSKLVPLLTGALKEAIAKIEALEARVTALEDA